jgi:CelD/BcsL family acetyltransferase involved in cellulose biosynthesis
MVLKGGGPSCEVTAMQIDVLDTLEAIAGLRENWEAVYAADPEAQFFLSWTWNWNSMISTKGAWLVLAARPSAPGSGYVAFLPIRIRTRWAEGGLVNDLALGPIRLADYKGLICMPGQEEAAIPALSRHLESLRWATLDLENFTASENRIRLFLKPYFRRGFVIKEITAVGNDGSPDLCLCPYVMLPNDWDAYLDNDLSSNTRQKVRRFLKKVDQGGDLRITHASRETIERDLRILLEFWALKWSGRKGERTASIVKTTSIMLRRCFESGALFLPVLWNGERPLGALACLSDPIKGHLLFHSAGRDESFSSPPPGFILHAYAIRHAVRQGFTTYDFLRGNEAYK